MKRSDNGSSSPRPECQRVELRPMFTFANQRQPCSSLPEQTTLFSVLSPILSNRFPHYRIDKEWRDKTYLVLETVLETAHLVQKWYIRCTVSVDLRVNKLTHSTVLVAIPFVSKRQQLSFSLALFSTFERDNCGRKVSSALSLAFTSRLLRWPRH